MNSNSNGRDWRWGRRTRRVLRLPTPRRSDRFDRLHQFGDAFACGGHRVEDGAGEAFGVKFQLHAVGAGAIGFVDDEDVGDLHDAGLDASSFTPTSMAAPIACSNPFSATRASRPSTWICATWLPPNRSWPAAPGPCGSNRPPIR